MESQPQNPDSGIILKTFTHAFDFQSNQLCNFIGNFIMDSLCG